MQNSLEHTVAERTVTETGHNMFCPGTTNLPDGRLLVNGGISSARTSIFDPVSGAWTTAAQMNIPRGYNANTLLADGSVLTLGGSWSGGVGNKHGELWTATDGWRRLNGVPIDSMRCSSSLVPSVTWMAANVGPSRNCTTRCRCRRPWPSRARRTGRRS